MKRLRTKKEIDERKNSVIRDGKAFITTFKEAQDTLTEMQFNSKSVKLSDFIGLLNRLVFDAQKTARDIDTINREDYMVKFNMDNEFLISEVKK